MSEPEAPHGYYDGPVKELALRHLGLIKAVFLLMLVYLPVGFIGAEVAHYKLPRAEWTSNSYNSYRNWGRSPPEDARSVTYSYAGYPLGKAEYEFLSQHVPNLFMTFLLFGFGLMIYRFHRLAKLLYPHLASYFTVMCLVPGLNLVVVLLLLRSALYQMRSRGMRVGAFGIDPARFDKA